MFPVVPVPVTATGRASCVASDVLRRVGDKWSLLVMAVLADRPYGFNELDRAIHEVSRRILIRTLRSLERDGLVSRGVHGGTVPRTEYALTDLGASLLPLVVAVGRWAEAHDADIRAARARHDSAGPGPTP